MKRFLSFVALFTLVGLVVVYGEVEAVRIGYDIQQLNIRQRELTHRLKEGQFLVAKLTSLDTLENEMKAQQVNLVTSKHTTIAKAGSREGDSSDKTPVHSILAKFKLRTARAGQ